MRLSLLHIFTSHTRLRALSRQGVFFHSMKQTQFFARKSAPPPPEDDQPNQQPGQQQQQQHQATDDDSMEEDNFMMELDNPFDTECSPTPRSHPPLPPLQPPPPPPPPPPQSGCSSDSSKQGQPTRTSTGAGLGKGDSSIDPDLSDRPNVDVLLASLEATVGLGENRQMESPTTPLPSVPTHSTADPADQPAGSIPTEEEKKTTPKKKRKPRNPRKKKTVVSTGCQRTDGISATESNKGEKKKGKDEDRSGKGMKAANDDLHQNSAAGNGTRSQNRQWTASGFNPPVNNLSSASSTSLSAYSRKPNQIVCTDITSIKFLPEDRERVEIVLQIILGEKDKSIEQGKNGNSTIVHNFPTVFSESETNIPAVSAPGAKPTEDGDNDFISVMDFPSRYHSDEAIFHSVPKRTTITFLLMFRPRNSVSRWDIPDFESAADFVNDALCQMYHQDAPFVEAYERTGKWGIIPTIILRSDTPSGILDFRLQLTRWSFKDMDFDTFPRDVAVMKPDLSILLRSNMKSFQLEVLPKVLFLRNKERLAGSLRVLSHRIFPTGEKSHKGESKDQWRQVELKGDEQVLRCLRFIPESFPFKLGVEPVQIRGGLRPQDPAEGNPTSRKRTWSKMDQDPSPPPVILSPSPSSSSGWSGSQHPPSSQRGGFPKRGRGATRGRGRRGNRGK